MKIALVCGHFIPSLGYIEVHLAQAFSKIGHEIHVITTNRVPPYARSLAATNQEDQDGVIIHRFKPWFEMGQIIIAKGIPNLLSELSPDLIIIIGLGKVFPKSALSSSIPTLVLLGDNKHSYTSKNKFGKLKTQFLIRFFKRPVYQAAIRSKAMLVAYTPESFDAAADILPETAAQLMREQSHFSSLGFWPDEFSFSAEERKKIRSQFGIADNTILLITATRLVPEKELELAVNWVATLPERIHWFLIGGDKSPYSNDFELKAKEKLGERFCLLPFQSKQLLRKLYSAADAALYTIPAISIFEAMGTGLFAFMPNLKALSHIIDSPESGCYFTDLNHFEPEEWIIHFVHDDAVRTARSLRFARRFAWQEIAADLLQILPGAIED